jgi:hypothetical protein
MDGPYTGIIGISVPGSRYYYRIFDTVAEFDYTEFGGTHFRPVPSEWRGIIT